MAGYPFRDPLLFQMVIVLYKGVFFVYNRINTGQEVHYGKSIDRG